jgi:hypothetical protein
MTEQPYTIEDITDANPGAISVDEALRAVTVEIEELDEPVEAMRTDAGEAMYRHKLNVENLQRLRQHRDNLNALIRQAVVDEQLSRRVLRIYDLTDLPDEP